MKHSYIIIDDDHNSVLKTRAIASRFQNLQFVAAANNYNDGLDLILQHNPQIVFLEIDPARSSSNLSLHLINELYRYLKVVPKIIVTTRSTELAVEAIRYEVLDYYTKPFEEPDLRRTLMRYEKALEMPAASFAAPVLNVTLPVVPETMDNTAEEIPAETAEAPIVVPVVIDTAETPSEALSPEIENEQSSTVIIDTTPKEEKPLIICVKSYGDYRFIEAKDICYLQADNNSTDIHLFNGEMITAFKTLKHFESVLESPFVRIHNSYIVNIDYVSRIHTGNAVCYIKNTTTKLPFSKSYKENVDAILNSISKGNYLEI